MASGASGAPGLPEAPTVLVVREVVEKLDGQKVFENMNGSLLKRRVVWALHYETLKDPLNAQGAYLKSLETLNTALTTAPVAHCSMLDELQIAIMERIKALTMDIVAVREAAANPAASAGTLPGRRRQWAVRQKLLEHNRTGSESPGVSRPSSETVSAGGPAGAASAAAAEPRPSTAAPSAAAAAPRSVAEVQAMGTNRAVDSADWSAIPSTPRGRRNARLPAMSRPPTAKLKTNLDTLFMPYMTLAGKRTANKVVMSAAVAGSQPQLVTGPMGDILRAKEPGSFDDINEAAQVFEAIVSAVLTPLCLDPSAATLDPADLEMNLFVCLEQLLFPTNVNRSLGTAVMAALAPSGLAVGAASTGGVSLARDAIVRISCAIHSTKRFDADDEARILSGIEHNLFYNSTESFVRGEQFQEWKDTESARVRGIFAARGKKKDGAQKNAEKARQAYAKKQYSERPKGMAKDGGPSGLNAGGDFLTMYASLLRRLESAPEAIALLGNLGVPGFTPSPTARYFPMVEWILAEFRARYIIGPVFGALARLHSLAVRFDGTQAKLAVDLKTAVQGVIAAIDTRYPVTRVELAQLRETMSVVREQATYILSNYAACFPEGRPPGGIRAVMELLDLLGAAQAKLADVIEPNVRHEAPTRIASSLLGVLEAAHVKAYQQIVMLAAQEHPPPRPLVRPTTAAMLTCVAQDVLAMVDDRLLSYGDEFRDIDYIGTLAAVLYREYATDVHAFVEADQAARARLKSGDGTASEDITTLQEMFELAQSIRRVNSSLLHISPNLRSMPLYMLFAPYLHRFLTDTSDSLADWTQRAVAADEWTNDQPPGSSSVVDIFCALDKAVSFFSDFVWLVEGRKKETGNAISVRGGGDSIDILGTFQSVVSSVMTSYVNAILAMMLEEFEEPEAAEFASFTEHINTAVGQRRQNKVEAKSDKLLAKARAKVANIKMAAPGASAKDKANRLNNTLVAKSIQSVDSKMSLQVNDIELCRQKLDELVSELESHTKLDVSELFVDTFAYVKEVLRRAVQAAVFRMHQFILPTLRDVVMSTDEHALNVHALCSYFDTQLQILVETLLPTAFSRLLRNIWDAILVAIEILLLPVNKKHGLTGPQAERLGVCLEVLLDYLHASGDGLDVTLLRKSSAFHKTLIHLYDVPTLQLVELHAAVAMTARERASLSMEGATEDAQKSASDGVTAEHVEIVLSTRTNDKEAAKFLKAVAKDKEKEKK